MIIDTASLENTETYNADICIIGGGVAGIVLANEFLSDNKNIVLLESGDEFYEEETQELYQAQSIPENFPSPYVSRLRLLGGSSNHWENSTERFDPIDFKKREWVSDSGWPITYEELARYYPEAEEYCNVGANGYDFQFWKEKLNIKDMLSESKLFNSVVSKSSEYPTQFFDEYGEKLITSNKIRVIKNANAVDLIYNLETQEVSSLSFRSTRQDTLHTVNAKTFIMAMGGIENARMLLTLNEKYENRLGNQFDNVGRYFMEHPTIRAAHLLPLQENSLDPVYEGIMDDALHIRGRASLSEAAQTEHQTNNMRMYFTKQAEIALSDGISSSHIVSDSLADTELPDDFGGHLVNIVKDIDHIAESFLKKKLDTSFFDSAYEFGGYQMISMIEQTPDRDNRVKLGDEKDQLGIKKVEIDFRVTQSDKDAAWKTLELLAQDPGIQSIGRIKLLKERESRIWASQLGFGQHHIGTTKMSDKPESGVVDPSLKVFGTKNLYITGSSVFPTGGHVPPTLTIVAISIKLARELRSAV
ncbi:GMC oxidoreductase [Pseudomonadota bacterium]